MLSPKSILQKIAPAVVVIAVWYATAKGVLIFRDVAFPTPYETLLKLISLIGGEPLADAPLLDHLLSSLKRWAAGFGIAASLGCLYGIVAGRVRLVEIATARIPQMLLLVPGLAWIPVAILLFGIGETATVFMIAISAFAPIAVNVLSGIKSIDIRFIRAAQMMGAGRNTMFFKVLIPAALPSILSGLRIGLGTGWRVLVAAEMVVGSGTGLGYSLIQARWTLDYASSFACLAIICAIGLFFEHILLSRLEAITVKRWAPAEEGL